MKLLGRHIPARALVQRIEDRLHARGLEVQASGPIQFEKMGAKVDPLAFNLSALEENADSTRGLPLSTHRAAVGRAVVLAKWAFRKTCQVFINEALGRQRAFNGHVRDSYAQLAAEVVKLRRDVEALTKKQKKA